MSASAQDRWQVAGRLSYAGIPYQSLQQGTKKAPNADQLQVNVQLATSQLELSMPWGTQLSLQLPVGRLSTTSLSMSRTDTNIGDMELRVRQTLPWLRTYQIQLGAGVAVPTGPYVERSGAANLPPEASFLTLGRGVGWAIGEAQASSSLSDSVSMYAQLSARTPLGQTKDEFSWGTEARGVVGSRATLPYGFSALAIAELQWRGGASEPDPFSDARLTTVNAGGTWWTLTPAISYAVRPGVSVLGGLRIPVRSNVAGNQLVPSLGGFLALSASWAPPSSGPRRLLPAVGGSDEQRPTARPTAGKITVIDYWATWCAPCKRIDASLAKAEPSWPDVDIVKVDASEWPEGSVRLPDGAQGLPVVEIYDARGKRVRILKGPEALSVVDIVNSLRKQ